MFSKLAEIDFPGITFTKQFKVRNWLDLAGSHEISTHARDDYLKIREPHGKSARLGNYDNVPVYTKYWFVKSITESFTSFVSFFLYVLKS